MSGDESRRACVFRTRRRSRAVTPRLMSHPFVARGRRVDNLALGDAGRNQAYSFSTRGCFNSRRHHLCLAVGHLARPSGPPPHTRPRPPSTPSAGSSTALDASRVTRGVGRGAPPPSRRPRAVPRTRRLVARRVRVGARVEPLRARHRGGPRLARAPGGRGAHARGARARGRAHRLRAGRGARVRAARTATPRMGLARVALSRRARARRGRRRVGRAPQDLGRGRGAPSHGRRRTAEKRQRRRRRGAKRRRRTRGRFREGFRETREPLRRGDVADTRAGPRGPRETPSRGGGGGGGARAGRWARWGRAVARVFRREDRSAKVGVDVGGGERAGAASAGGVENTGGASATPPTRAPVPTRDR